MDYPEVAPRTFVLKYILCPCKAHGKKVKKRVLEIHGVDSVDIDMEECKATISGTVDSATVMKELENCRIKAELLWEETPPVNNHQEMQIVLQQKPVPQIHALQTVARQPGYEFTGIALKADPDESTAKKADDCYRNQNHELELKRYSKRFTCDGCKEDGFGLRYRCEQCDYELHEVCNSRKPTIFCDLFKGSIFEFCHNKGHARSCDACGKDIHGYSYHCKAKGLNLHPPCSNLRCQLSIDDTVFALRDKDKVLSDCLWCSTKKPSSWSYVSRCNEYKFHVHCIAEMLHEAWKQGADNTEDTSKALQTMELKLMAKHPNRRGGSSGVFWKTVRAFLGIILSVLLGDPIGLIASTVAAF